MGTNNYTFTGLDEEIHLGENGPIIKSVDDNNAIAIKDPTDGKYLITRGAPGAYDNDFITKAQFDAEHKQIEVNIDAASTTKVTIGDITNNEYSINVEYLLKNDNASNDTRYGTLKAVVNPALNTNFSDEFVFVGNEIEDVEFTVTIESPNIILNIINSGNTQYKFFYASTSLSNMKLTPAMVIDAKTTTTWISNLISANEEPIEPDDAFLIIENTSFEKKKMTLEYLRDTLNGAVSIQLLDEVIPEDNDLILIEDASDSYSKKKTTVAEFRSNLILDTMSFNA